MAVRRSPIATGDVERLARHPLRVVGRKVKYCRRDVVHSIRRRARQGQAVLVAAADEPPLAPSVKRPTFSRMFPWPVTSRPARDVLVAGRVTRPGSFGGAVMRRTLLAIIMSALAAGGMSLAQHDEHGKGGDYVKLLSQKDIIEKLDGKKAKATMVEVTLAPG